jgi:hypothetical protein
MKKLTRQQYDELYTQFSRTPDPSDGGGSGEHMILALVLRKCGYIEENRRKAYRMAEKLLDMGFEDER